MSLLPTHGRKIPELALREGIFLEQTLPLVTFATLTLPSRPSREQFRTSLNSWLMGLQSYNAVTLGWVRSFEPDPQLHSHIAIMAARRIDHDHAVRHWTRFTGSRSLKNVDIQTYRYGIGGLAYIMKSLDRQQEDVEFSANLTSFVENKGLHCNLVNARARRQQRRIKSQIAIHGPNAFF